MCLISMFRNLPVGYLYFVVEQSKLKLENLLLKTIWFLHGYWGGEVFFGIAEALLNMWRSGKVCTTSQKIIISVDWCCQFLLGGNPIFKSHFSWPTYYWHLIGCRLNIVLVHLFLVCTKEFWYLFTAPNQIIAQNSHRHSIC